MSQSKVRVAVIGCGHWGPNHIRVFNSLPQSKTVMAVDSDSKRISSLQQLHPDLLFESDYRVAISDPQIDAIVVATPARSHYNIVREALENGKHVLCEKPLCVSSEESLALADLAKQKQRVLAVGYVFLFNAGIRKLGELVHSGELGEILYVSVSRTNLGPIRSDVNVVFDLTTHDISILNYLLRQYPQQVSATAGSYLRKNTHDVAFINLQYKDQLIANITASWLDPRKIRQITVVGDKKMALWDDLNMSGPVTVFDKSVIKEPQYTDYSEFLRLSIQDRDTVIPKVNLGEPLKVQNQSFLDNIINNTAPFNDAMLDYHVIRILEQINRSIESAGRALEILSETEKS